MSRSSPDVITDGVSSSPELKEDASVNGVQVMEAQPSGSQTPNVKKRKELISEMMDLDNYEEQPQQGLVIGEKDDTKNKGKGIKHQSNDFGYHQPKASFPNKIKLSDLSSYSAMSANDSLSKYDLANGYGYSEEWFEDPANAQDQFEMLQACVDSMDFPSGVEENIPWYPALAQIKEKKVDWNVEKTGGNVEMLQACIDKMDFPSSVEADVSWFSALAENEGKKLGEEVSFPSPGGVYTGKIQPASEHHGYKLSKGKKKLLGSSSSSKDSSTKVKQLKKFMAALNGAEQSYLATGEHKAGFLDTFPTDITDFFQDVHAQTWFGTPIEKSTYDPFGAMRVSSENEIIDTAEDTHIDQSSIDVDEIRRKFQLFKQFDTAEDFTDHFYLTNVCSNQQPPKQWAKSIQEEWRMLEKDLPDTIFVRIYESRMDILRAAIIGAEGTPYHDGLFFFDFFFPNSYPNVPPLVHYHSGGLRINPNLYNSGKVCLSLLNTWSGDQNEKWIAGTSTMLQVLVSIQALILNKDPFFNEPGYERMKGSKAGVAESRQYNEEAFVLSLKIMLYTMRRPPKHFEDFVVGHFYNRAHDILSACKAYYEGAPVGSLVKGGVQNIEAHDISRYTRKFKDSLKGVVKLLVKEFSKIGVKDCDKFLIPEETKPLVDSCKDANPNAAAAVPDEILH